jgi:hypothetical protein
LVYWLPRRLDNVILEAIKNLKEPTGSHRTTIANYIEVFIHILFCFLLVLEFYGLSTSADIPFPFFTTF